MRRLFSITLAFAVGFSSPAFALKPPAPREGGGLEELTLSLTSGMEEKAGSFGLTLKDVEGLKILFKIRVPQTESLEALRGLIEQVVAAESEIRTDPTRRETEAEELKFLQQILKKLNAREGRWVEMTFQAPPLQPAQPVIPTASPSAVPSPAVSFQQAEPPSGTVERFGLTAREVVLFHRLLETSGLPASVQGLRLPTPEDPDVIEKITGILQAIRTLFGSPSNPLGDWSENQHRIAYEIAKKLRSAKAA